MILKMHLLVTTGFTMTILYCVDSLELRYKTEGTAFYQYSGHDRKMQHIHITTTLYFVSKVM